MSRRHPPAAPAAPHPLVVAWEALRVVVPLAAALLAAALWVALLSGCGGAQPDARAAWRMPGAIPAGEAQAAAPGYAWRYNGEPPAEGVGGRGDLPETGLPPRDGLWRADEQQALRLAGDLDRLVVIDFYADWCAPCARMAAETFRDPQLRKTLKGDFVALQIDVTEETMRGREQLARYQVFTLPTLLVVGADGLELDRVERFIDAGALHDRLQALRNQHHPAGAAHVGAPSAPPAKPAKPRAPWCAPELEALPGDVCFYGHEARKDKGARRTLVVFLHGWVQDGLNWQHAQQRAIVRGGRRHGFSVIAPRGRTGGSASAGPNTVSWPTSPAAQAQHEAALIAQWQAARQLIERRQGVPFDEVFVVGFSNGAYYASSLAMRGRLPVQGYAMFAGGSAYAPQAPAAKRAPVFVGICSKDDTAKRARELRRQLRRVRWPHKAESRKVGHTMADAHLDHAIAYLRGRVDAAAGGPKAKP